MRSEAWIGSRDTDKAALLPPHERVEFTNGKRTTVYVAKADTDPWAILAATYDPELLRLKVRLRQDPHGTYRDRGPWFQAALAKYRALQEAAAMSRKPTPAIVIEGEDAESIPDQPAPVVGVIYFIRSGDFVKIGFTTKLTARLASIATSSPAPPVVMATKRGTVHHERELHRQFAGYRTHREWFRLEGDLAAYIEALPK